MTAPQVIHLEEYVPRSFSPVELPDESGEAIWKSFSAKVNVEFPSPKTGGQWQLTSQGWVGRIPVDDRVQLSLRPKVPIANIFRMLEYAYRIQSFQFLEDLVGCDTIEDVYERLAHVLAKRVLDRVRKGLYRAYVGRSEHLPFVRERLDVNRHIRRPWDVRVYCYFKQHTADVEENQLLAWTLFVLTRGSLQRPDVLQAVRQAFRSLQGTVSLQAFSANACRGRIYNRLNDDYEPLHVLCRFFLDHAGPQLEHGHHTTLPFLVNMAQLFESFVAAWMEAHLPAGLVLHPQERYGVGENTYFNIDLVLYDREKAGSKDQARMVLDTKYKRVASPLADDVEQIVAYAVAKHCREAVLVYPAPLSSPLDTYVGDIHVRSVSFCLGDDIQYGGDVFQRELLRFSRTR